MLSLLLTGASATLAGPAALWHALAVFVRFHVERFGARCQCLDGVLHALHV
jgi:hypothetical protein